MSMSTCARSAGAIFYMAEKDREILWPLARMHDDMQRLGFGDKKTSPLRVDPPTLRGDTRPV